MYTREQVKAMKELVLKIEYHRDMAFALKEDASSKSEFILKKHEQLKVHTAFGETDIRESLKKGEQKHLDLYKKYLQQFNMQYPDINNETVFQENEHWMVDTIANNFDPLEDPIFDANVKQVGDDFT
jgi:hypothetical protein